MRKRWIIVTLLALLLGGGYTRTNCDAAGNAATQKANPNQKYTPATPEETEFVGLLAKAFSEAIEKKIAVKFTKIETDHFQIYTDWDPAEYGFLKKYLEEAYGVITKQFDIPVSENIFMGKLPVFMLAHQRDFEGFVDNFTSLGKARAPGEKAANVSTLLGFHATRNLPLKDGTTFDFSYMCMWKPVVDPKATYSYALDNPKIRWAYVLAHEMTHAFVHRYRSDRRLPTWLNEGIAEVVASSAVPDPDAIAYAKEYAQKNKSIQKLFQETGSQPGEMYPVMRTLTETLVMADKKAFLGLFGDLKDGASMEDALKKHYHTDYAGLEAAWRKYLATR